MLRYTGIAQHHHKGAISLEAPRASSPLFESVETSGVVMPFERNGEIFGDNEPADYLYKVVSGAVRTYRVLHDGRRQVCGFYLPGEIFGLEAGEDHTCSAEAITPSTVALLKRRTIVALAQEDGDVARQLWGVTARELHRAQQHALLLIKSAQERVAALLLDMAERLRAGRSFELPMSRQDIADFLGLTIETVSRTLTQFQQTSAIELATSRRMILRNRQALINLDS